MIIRRSGNVLFGNFNGECLHMARNVRFKGVYLLLSPLYSSLEPKFKSYKLLTSLQRSQTSSLALQVKGLVETRSFNFVCIVCWCTQGIIISTLCMFRTCIKSVIYYQIDVVLCEARVTACLQSTSTGNSNIPLNLNVLPY